MLKMNQVVQNISWRVQDEGDERFDDDAKDSTSFLIFIFTLAEPKGELDRWDLDVVVVVVVVVFFTLWGMAFPPIIIMSMEPYISLMIILDDLGDLADETFDDFDDFDFDDDDDDGVDVLSVDRLLIVVESEKEGDDDDDDDDDEAVGDLTFFEEVFLKGKTVLRSAFLLDVTLKDLEARLFW